MSSCYKSWLLVAVAVGGASIMGLYLRPAFAGEIGVREGFMIGPFLLRFYSLTMFAAVGAGYLLARRRSSLYGISLEQLDTVAVLCVISGLAGARLHHVLTQWSFYRMHPELIAQIWRGGLGIYGGIAAGIVGVLLYTRLKKKSFLKVADLLAPPLALGQAIGRWGNFFNQEAYGLPTDVAWKLFIDAEHRLPGFEQFAYFHPLFLYESVWNLLVVALLLKANTRTSGAGTIFGWYLILYSLGRFLIEGLRADITLLGAYPLNQIIALLAALGGLFVLVVARQRGRSVLSSR